MRILRIPPLGTPPGHRQLPDAGSPVSLSRRDCLALLAGSALLPSTASAQERFSLFVGSPQFTVDRMVKMAQLRDDDVVVDLGSGDGRIVLSALKANP